MVRLLLGGGVPLVIFARTTSITSHVLAPGYCPPSVKCCGHVQSFFKNNKYVNYLHCSREIDVNMRKGNKNNFVVNSEVLWKKQLELIRKMRKRTKHAAEV